MIAEADASRLAEFLGKNLETLLARSEPLPEARREIQRRMLSVLVDRFCLREPGLAWEELTRNPYGLCAVLDGLDEIERAALRMLLGSPDGVATARALERGIDELRSDCIRFQKRKHGKELIDTSVLEHIPQPLFLVERTLHVEGMNRAGREIIERASSTQCHAVLFGRRDPCPDCPLDDVVERGVSVTCTPQGGLHPRVGLSPVSASAAVAHVLASIAPSAEDPNHVSANAAVVESISSGVVVLDAVGRIAYANRRARELLGTLEEGRAMATAAPGIVVDESGRQRELHHHASGPRQTVIGYRCVPAILHGARHVVVTLRDLTELRRMHEDVDRMQRLSEVGRMCASVAHEIRNPLAGIMATIQSIEREASAAGLSEPLRIIQGEVKRLADMLNSFFAFVRWQPPRRRPTDIALLVQRARKAAAPKLRAATVVVERSGLRPVWVDPDQLEQVLLNLLINAADAMDGRGTIRVRAAIEGGSLGLQVADAGCGIPEEMRERVFDAFFTTKAHGSGLGLSVCYRVVTAHGGKVSIHGQPGRGTRVDIDIPLVEEEEEEDARCVRDARS